MNHSIKSTMRAHLIGGALVLGTSGPLYSQVTVTDNGATAPTIGASDTGYTGTTNARWGWDSGEGFTQTFTSPITGAIDAIYIAYNGFNDGETLTLDLLVNGSSVATGILLDGNNFSGDTGSDGQSSPSYWMKFDLTSANVPVTAGSNSFTMNATADTGDSWAFAPMYNNTNPYAGGALDLSFSIAGGDMGFAVIISIPDEDMDGISDDYELANTEPPSTTALEPALDDDSDGLNNLQEFLGQDSTGTVHGFGQTMASEADTDGDGLNDGPEVSGTDNSDVVHGYGPTNPNDDDSDDGGIGDGINDGDEISGALNSANSYEATDPNTWDSDGDYMSDLYEVTNNLLGGLDPNDIADGDLGADLDSDGLDNYEEHDSSPQTRADMADTDNDGYTDDVETNLGPDSWYNENDTGTNPVVADTDGDGLPDGDENPDTGSSPPASAPYKSDPTLFDTDGDFYSDGDEVAAGSDPFLDTSVPTGIPVRNIDFTSISGGWTNAGGTTLESTTELLPGSGQYALVDCSSLGRGVILEYPNPAVPPLVHNVANCSVDFRVDGTLGGAAGGFSFTSGGLAQIATSGGTHCIVRLFEDGRIDAYDGSAWQSVVASGGIVSGTTYTVEIDHNITGETYDVRVFEAATSAPVGSLGGIPTRPTSDPAADPLYFNVGSQTPQGEWDVAIDNMTVDFSTVSELKITNVAFVGGDLEITFSPGGAGYILTSSDDLEAAFVEETNANYDGVDTFTVPAVYLNPEKDFFRVEDANP